MEEKNLDAMMAPVEAAPKAEEQDRLLAALQELTARIDVTDLRLQRHYGETVLGALADVLSSSETEKLLLNSESVEVPFALPSDSHAAVQGIKLWLTKLFRGAAAKEESLRKQYVESEQKVVSVAEKLEARQLTLAKEIERLDKLQSRCDELLQMLSIYHQAGRQRLRRERETTLSSKKEIARRTGLSRDAQNVREFEEQCRLFEARLYTLEEKIAVSERILPQLALLKEAKADMARSLHECLLGDVPLWRENADSAEGGLSGREENLRAADKAFAAAMERLTSSAEGSAQTALAAGKTLADLARRLRGDAAEE